MIMSIKLEIYFFRFIHWFWINFLIVIWSEVSSLLSDSTSLWMILILFDSFYIILFRILYLLIFSLLAGLGVLTVLATFIWKFLLVFVIPLLIESYEGVILGPLLMLR